MAEGRDVLNNTDNYTPESNLLYYYETKQAHPGENTGKLSI
jgi:hypothetical protein